MDFVDLVSARRSVRTFSDRSVDEDTIKRVVECARLAPSWKNAQGWHFLVIRDPVVISDLVNSGAFRGNRWLANAPTLIIACGRPAASSDLNGIPYFAVDVAIAFEHLVLAATELGLGTCWVGVFDEAKLRQACGIPDPLRIVALTPLGYPADDMSVRERLTRMAVRSHDRHPLEDILHLDRW